MTSIQSGQRDSTRTKSLKDPAPYSLWLLKPPAKRIGTVGQERQGRQGAPGKGSRGLDGRAGRARLRARSGRDGTRKLVGVPPEAGGGLPEGVPMRRDLDDFRPVLPGGAAVSAVD